LPALAYTNISKGLAMGLSYFQQQSSQTGSRIILLVSDGAAVIDPDSEAKIRRWAKQLNIRLYWIFMRSENSPGLYEKPENPRDDNAGAMPERYLHLFFTSLGIPYKAYQAENPDAVQDAINDINQLENMPLHVDDIHVRKNSNAASFFERYRMPYTLLLHHHRHQGLQKYFLA
jgi:mxaC protein